MTALNEADVLDRFALLCGLTSDAAETFKGFCTDAKTQIEQNERGNCGPEASGPLSAAAAALAFLRMTLAQSARGEESFQAGDLRVAPGAADPESARGLWLNALGAAAPYLNDERFLFRSVLP